jgi:hypothetical protein
MERRNRNDPTTIINPNGGAGRWWKTDKTLKNYLTKRG